MLWLCHPCAPHRAAVVAKPVEGGSGGLFGAGAQMPSWRVTAGPWVDGQMCKVTELVVGIAYLSVCPLSVP